MNRVLTSVELKRYGMDVQLNDQPAQAVRPRECHITRACPFGIDRGDVQVPGHYAVGTALRLVLDL
jgi:hypothetical protein